jgi:hypothetical protein
MARYSRSYRARFYRPPADDEAIEAPASRGENARRGGAGGRGVASAGRIAYEEEDDDEDDDDLEDDDDEGEDPDERTYALVNAPADWDNLTTVPCGVCPVFDQCVPGGVISPETCAYYSKWLLN